MKILMIYPAPKFPIETPLTIPTGTLAVTSFLHSKGHDVLLFDRRIEWKKDLSKIITDFSPDLVGITIFSACNLRDGVECAKTAQGLGVKTCFGGPHATAIYKELLQEGGGDFVGIGEGEYTTLELLEAVAGKRSVESVKGIAYKDKDGVVHLNEPRELADLADFPQINFELVDIPKYLMPRYGFKKVIDYNTAKGCPYACTFCSSKSIHRRRYRKRPTEMLLAEIKILVTEYGVDFFSFCDEMFGANKEELWDFCSRLKALNLKFSWICQTCIGHLNAEDMAMMKDAGCFVIGFGIESGSPEILKQINKNYDPKLLKSHVENLKKSGMTSSSFYIFGFPGETTQQCRQTIHVHFRVNSRWGVYSIFQALPGTESYKELCEQGKIPFERSLADHFADDDDERLPNYSNMPTKDLLVILRFFQWHSSFLNRSSEGFTLVNVGRALRNLYTLIFGHGFINGVVAFYRAIKLFLHVFWYSHAYPSIRKKYDLDVKNFGRNDWDDLPSWE